MTVNYKTWNYYIPYYKGEGEAFIFLTSNGCFSAVSDFGNYSYVWRNPGVDDFRKYWIKDKFDINYLASKFNIPLKFDGNFNDLALFVNNSSLFSSEKQSILLDLEEESYEVFENFFPEELYKHMNYSELFVRFVNETLPKLKELISLEFGLDNPCIADWRNGIHELYIKDSMMFCKACGNHKRR